MFSQEKLLTLIVEVFECGGRVMTLFLQQISPCTMVKHQQKKENLEKSSFFNLRKLTLKPDVFSNSVKGIIVSTLLGLISSGLDSDSSNTAQFSMLVCEVFLASEKPVPKYPLGIKAEVGSNLGKKQKTKTVLYLKIHPSLQLYPLCPKSFPPDNH